MLASIGIRFSEKLTTVTKTITKFSPTHAKGHLGLIGPRVRGGMQFGLAGQKTVQPIPIHAKTGEMDPRFDSDGNLKAGFTEPSPGFVVANHGHTYATALKLAGVNPQGLGRNEEAFLPFVMKS